VGALVIVLAATAGCDGSRSDVDAAPAAIPGGTAAAFTTSPGTGGLTGITGLTTRPLTDAVLYGPDSAGASFDRWAATDTLPEELTRRVAEQSVTTGVWPETGAAHAAAGHEFLLLEGSQPKHWISETQNGGHDTFAVVVDGVKHTLDFVHAISADSVLLVEVPTGASATLQMTSFGRTQSLDLRSGKRGADAVAAYYPYRSGLATLDTEGRSDIGTTVEVGLDVTLSLAGYDEEKGWAPEGHTWVRVNAHLGTIELTGRTGEYTVTVDLSKTLTGVRVPAGLTLSANGQPALDQPTAVEQSWLTELARPPARLTLAFKPGRKRVTDTAVLAPAK
jgi:hypothetical protein